jgi:sugar/nucleoside kinase (ribokinase family)
LGQNHTPLSCRPGVNALFTRACLPKFKKDFSGIIVSGSAFMPGLNDCDFTDYLEQAKKNNPSLVIGVSIGGQGPGSKNFIRFSGLADIMVLNHHEALELFKYDFTLFDPEKFEKKGFFERKSRLKKIIPGFTLPSVFIITLADKGCLCIYRDKNKKTSALKLNNTEPFYYTAGTICRANQNTGFIGAGDKFFGALAAQILLSPQKIDEFSGAELKSIIKETMSHIIY